jgi:ElaB/YqjD/DUF883 family membrane-anchored ribosome-binding protein
MDQTRAQEIAKDAAEQGRKTANVAAQRVGDQVQPALDQAKSAVQDLANQASEAVRQATTRASEFVESVAPQVREAASNIYDRGSQSGEYVRQYVPQDPLVAMLDLLLPKMVDELTAGTKIFLLSRSNFGFWTSAMGLLSSCNRRGSRDRFSGLLSPG